LRTPSPFVFFVLSFVPLVVQRTTRPTEEPTTKDTKDTKNNKHELWGWEPPSPFVSFVPSFVPLVVQFGVPLRLCASAVRRVVAHEVR
jgi:hypothetical protein